MADSKRKRKRPSAAISIYRGDEDDKDGDEDATMNRDMTFSRRHGRLGQSSGAIPADNPIPAQEPPAADTLEWFYDDNMDNPSVDTPTTTGTSKTKTTDEQKTMLQEWLPLRSLYLDELIRHDGRGGQMCCVACTDDQGGLFRCKDCFGGSIFCQSCLCNSHRLLPFHRVEQWTGSFFRRTTLKTLGMVYHVGHNGNPCTLPGNLHPDFVIVDTSGVHLVNIQFCGCHTSIGASHPRSQLLRTGLLPATIERPNTAFTFDLLNSFHLLTLQGKTSAFHFYWSVSHKTDNVGLYGQKDRYDQFLFAMRLWRHLKLLKRTGRGHDPSGVANTQPGQCAIECPACPHPDRNLPAGWESATLEQRWIYALILTIDANFRLKNKDRKVTSDPPLGDGWGHWVPSAPYHDYIAKYGYQEEPNLCDSTLRAVDHANTKKSLGYKSTGVGAVVCARHGLVRKNGLGDLQKGERYANMDFIVLYTLIEITLILLILSYDIACQWSRNLKTRIPQFPSSMRIPVKVFTTIRYVIPKFHIYGHGARCQFRFSLNFLRWSARTNGEEPERWWAHINPVSMSTKEMSPGSRADTIDDHAAAWNFRKVTGFGSSLRKQLTKAVPMSAKHRAIAIKFTARFEPATVEKWKKMIADWDSDQSKPCPYVEVKAGSTAVAVQKELADEEVAEVSRGDIQLHEVTPATFLRVGLELEEQQRVLLSQSVHATSNSKTSALVDKRNALRYRITKWQEVQNVYMPAVVQLRQGSASSPDQLTQPERIHLLLPSAIPTLSRLSLAGGLADKERRMRIAQADDSLTDLRRMLRITMGLWDYKITNVGPSQVSSTRTRTMIDGYRTKVTRCVERYRAARNSLLQLDPNGEWILRLKELKADDVRPPERREEDKKKEGKREVSWIWMGRTSNPDAAITEEEIDTVVSDEEMGDSLRSEWAKSIARADRWDEDIILITEEMRRVLWFFDWKAVWWIVQGSARTDVSDELREGLSAYAAKQEGILQSLASTFADEWYPELARSGLVPDDWPAHYLASRSTPETDLHPPVEDVSNEVEYEHDFDDDIF